MWRSQCAILQWHSCGIDLKGTVGDYENVISSGFVDVTIVCFDQNGCVFERELTRNIMIFGYEGEGLVEVDGKKQILKPDDSLRIMRGSHIRMYPTTGQLKIGLTNFYI